MSTLKRIIRHVAIENTVNKQIHRGGFTPLKLGSTERANFHFILKANNASSNRAPFNNVNYRVAINCAFNSYAGGLV